MLPNKIITFNVIHSDLNWKKLNSQQSLGNREVTHLLKVYAVNNQIIVKLIGNKVLKMNFRKKQYQLLVWVILASQLQLSCRQRVIML